MTEDRLRAFTERWYEIISDNREYLKFQAFVLDKRFYGTARARGVPLQLLSQVLFDRIEKHVAPEVAIIFDQMDKEFRSEKGIQGDILKVSDRVVNLGSFHERYSHVRPRFEKSCNSNFLQLADTAAYNVYRQFVDLGHLWDSAGNSRLQLYPYLARMKESFYLGPEGLLSGYGIVKAPSPSRPRWIVPQ
jgi:hypothetical protein